MLVHAEVVEDLILDQEVFSDEGRRESFNAWSNEEGAVMPHTMYVTVASATGR